VTPAERVISIMGGAKSVARILDKDVSGIYRWRYSKERNGTGGLVPQADAQRLLDYAASNGIDLSPADFFFDACVPHPEALHA